MCPTHSSPSHRWDGSLATGRRRRALRVSTCTSPLLRAGQTARCRDCGNLLEWYHRTDHRPVPLHPRELPTSAVPANCRWHISSGIAHPADDGTAWCRLTHHLLCPARDTPRPCTPLLAEVRRGLAMNTRRLLNAGTFTPPTAPADIHPTATCRPKRPVVQLLYVRYLAARPIEDIQCIAQTRRRGRCTNPLLTTDAPTGTWTLQPATASRGQLALPATTMAVYDISHLPYTEQIRWRSQHCAQHPTTHAPDIAVTEWEPFDPLIHHQHIHPRLPNLAPHSRAKAPSART
ncbi:DUF6083 domain-containing protein [Streptomyces sp. NPDC051776]|uniref:DUF6083 domain-containing protein n=1 Tax=Streptomyces sp. NPDC051776 TaxID=3155414 RepID=UPI003436E853